MSSISNQSVPFPEPAHSSSVPSPLPPAQDGTRVKTPTSMPRVDRDLSTTSDGGYGWICVVAMLLITAHTWGINGVGIGRLHDLKLRANTSQAFGVYLSHCLANNVFAGTSEISYSFIGGLSISQITLIAPVVTRCSSCLGTR